MPQVVWKDLQQTGGMLTLLHMLYANTITWDEFKNSFREHHVPAGVIKLKWKEFLALKQDNMSVSEYRDKFTQLSRYAPNDVDTDAKRHDRFLDGLIGPLNYQLQARQGYRFGEQVQGTWQNEAEVPISGAI